MGRSLRMDKPAHAQKDSQLMNERQQIYSSKLSRMTSPKRLLSENKRVPSKGQAEGPADPSELSVTAICKAMEQVFVIQYQYQGQLLSQSKIQS